MKSAVQVWRRQQKDKHLLGKKGTILTWTKIVVAPPAYVNYSPYIVVLIELEDKKKVYGQLVDYDDNDIKIGTKVIAVLRRMGEVGVEDVIKYGLKFKPLIK